MKQKDQKELATKAVRRSKIKQTKYTNRHKKKRGETGTERMATKMTMAEL